MIKVDKTIISIDHNFDRIANVIAPTGWLGIWKTETGRVGINDPIQPAVAADDNIRILVIAEEWSQLLHSFPDIPVQQDSALTGNVAGKQYSSRAQTNSKSESPQQGSKLYASLALVSVISIALAGRVIEFVNQSVDDSVGIGALPVVDAGFHNLKIGFAPGRNIRYPEFRELLPRDFTHRAYHNPVSVGVLQMIIDPVPVLRQAHIQLPSGKQHFSVFTVNPIPPHIGVVEHIIRPHLLQLAVSLKDQTRIPQSDVADGALVGLKILLGQILGAAEPQFLEAVDRIGQARHLDMVFNIRPLAGKFVRRNQPLLHYKRRCHSPHETGCQPQGQCANHRLAKPMHTGGEHQACSGCQNHQHSERCQTHIHIGIAGAEHNPAYAVKQLICLQVVRGRFCQQQKANKH